MEHLIISVVGYLTLIAFTLWQIDGIRKVRRAKAKKKRGLR